MKAAKTESAANSAKQLNAKISNLKSESRETLGSASRQAKTLDARLTGDEKALFIKAANQINSAIFSANKIADKLLLKELRAEQRIESTARSAERSAMSAVRAIDQAALKAAQAVKYIHSLRDQALYSNNAAGQAMAAQMAQAMGFPISAKGVPSPFPPPPRIHEASMSASMVGGIPLKLRYSDYCRNFL